MTILNSANDVLSRLLQALIFCSILIMPSVTLGCSPQSTLPAAFPVPDDSARDCSQNPDSEICKKSTHAPDSEKTANSK